MPEDQAINLPTQADTQRSVDAIGEVCSKESTVALKQLITKLMTALDEVDEVHNVSRFFTSLELQVLSPGHYAIQLCETEAASIDRDLLLQDIYAEREAQRRQFGKQPRPIQLDEESQDHEYRH